jgi:hypothetical protein
MNHHLYFTNDLKIYRLQWFPLLFMVCILQAQGQQSIQVWHGDIQHFGDMGRAQRWVNVLGNVIGAREGDKLSYSLDGQSFHDLTLGGDLHRLAETGDFNVEISWEDLSPGVNTLYLKLIPTEGEAQQKEVELHVGEAKTWPLPYSVDFSELTKEDLQKSVQIVDGQWELTQSGLRTSRHFYDRVISVGDTTWKNYEATALITIHGFTPSEPGPPTYDVTHFGMAFRWRGHSTDGRQPSRQWYPLGAQGEFLLMSDEQTAKWRILFDGGQGAPKPEYAQKENSIALVQKMYIKGQVVTLENGDTRYRFKQWMLGDQEPEEWDVEGIEDGERDYSSGALCLVPHNSDVTLHNVMVEPLQPFMGDWYARPGPGNIHFSAPVGNVLGGNGQRFEAFFPTEGNVTLKGVQVNASHNVRGFRIKVGNENEEDKVFTFGHEEGDWSEWEKFSGDGKLEGISGRSGWYLDAIQFHLDSGEQPSVTGGKGGDTTFDFRLNQFENKSKSLIRGFHGTMDDYGIVSLGLIFDPAD